MWPAAVEARMCGWHASDTSSPAVPTTTTSASTLPRVSQVPLPIVRETQVRGTTLGRFVGHRSHDHGVGIHIAESLADATASRLCGLGRDTGESVSTIGGETTGAPIYTATLSQDRERGTSRSGKRWRQTSTNTIWFAPGPETEMQTGTSRYER